ncbi:ParB/RepB/Spo0J family partition protein (plasmid) [Microtetraspora malaysiensis]|uniref:ParB/RepB/Spo0J family partition protein n=1 Tax=Microtetraspora malaysiensis TaxID=161358 RepID=UPI003D9264B2
MPALVPQTYRMVQLDELEPHPDNPHKGDVDMIAESISRNGFYGVVLVQKSRMRIIAGEHRWRGARAKGLAEVPALVIDVDDEAATRIMLADNRTAEHGDGYDEQVLAELLQGLPDLDGTGWSDDDLADLLDDLDGGFDVVADTPAASRPAAPEPERPTGGRPSRPDPDDDEEDDGFDDEDEDEGKSVELPPPPRPKSGTTADLLLTLTAAEHDEVTGLLAKVRARDGDAPTTQIILAALRAYAA